MNPQLASLSSLEKAAILVSSLDRASADQLLEQMTEAMAGQVRAVIMELDEVDPELQQAVLEDFMNSQKAKPAANQKQPSMKDRPTPSNDVELDLHYDENEELALTESYSDRWNTNTVKQTQTNDDTSSSQVFAFLNEAESSILRRELEKEHPQTVAVVLAHVTPRRAAEVLEKLPTEMQTEVVRRMVDLDEMDAQVLQELAEGFAKQLEQHINQKRRRTNGMSRLANILAASQKETEERILQNLEQHRDTLTHNVNQARKRQSSQVDRERFASSKHEAPATIPFQKAANNITARAVPKFQDLAQLSDDALLHVLQHVASEVVVLALAGADSILVERITRRLPKKQGEMLNRALSHLGPTRLEEVDAAQQELIRTALELGMLRTMQTNERRLAAA